MARPPILPGVLGVLGVLGEPRVFQCQRQAVQLTQDSAESSSAPWSMHSRTLLLLPLLDTPRLCPALGQLTNDAVSLAESRGTAWGCHF